MSIPAEIVVTRGHSQEDRVALAGMVTQLFDHWGLKQSECAELLGLSPTNRSAIAGYRHGNPVAPNRDLIERIGHLLGIHKSLRILFPHDRDLAYAWLKTPNKKLAGHAPVEHIGENGFLGLVSVRQMLDVQRGR